MTALTGARDHAREQQQRCQAGLDYAAAHPDPRRAADWVERRTRERDLWAQIADELDAYLETVTGGERVDDAEQTLFDPPTEGNPDA